MRICKTGILAALAYTCTLYGTPQSQQTASAAPNTIPATTVQPPVPPSVTPPSINSPVFDSFSPPSPPAADKKKNAENRTQKAKNSAVQDIKNQKNAQRSNLQPSAAVQTKNNTGQNPSLSAANIGILSSLFGSENSFSLNALSSAASPANTTAFGIANNQNETRVLLQAILEKLDTLQKTVEPHRTKADTKAVPAKAAASQNGRILRFISGNYNILPTCTAVFISEPESDGSFLLTGDRKYRSFNKIHSETFYMLFKAAGSARFNVAVNVYQHTENPLSIFYTLEQSPVLVAVRTGNLVTMRTQIQNTTVDLLLEIGFNAQRQNP